MSPGYYHSPPKPVSTRARCPVCHEEVYSRAGIHPQCAIRQSEPPKPKKLAVDVTVAVAVPVAVPSEHAADPAPADLVAQPGLEILTTPGHAAE